MVVFSLLTFLTVQNQVQVQSKENLKKNLSDIQHILKSKIHQFECLNRQLDDVSEYFEQLIVKNERLLLQDQITYPVSLSI